MRGFTYRHIPLLLFSEKPTPLNSQEVYSAGNTPTIRVSDGFLRKTILLLDKLIAMTIRT